MECTRTVSHTYASCSGVLRPSRTYSKVTVSRPAPRCAQRLALRPCAVASISAPGSNSVGAPLQESPSVVEIPSAEAFESILKTNPEKLVILMCKATGCRPCKAFKPKYGKLAAHYHDAIFCEILGDRNEGTRNLMRSLKVRATPTFIFFRNGENVHMHSGISSEKMVDALKAAVLPKEAGFCEEVKYATAVLSHDED